MTPIHWASIYLQLVESQSFHRQNNKLISVNLDFQQQSETDTAIDPSRRYPSWSSRAPFADLTANTPGDRRCKCGVRKDNDDDYLFTSLNNSESWIGQQLEDIGKGCRSPKRFDLLYSTLQRQHFICVAQVRGS